MRVLRQLYASRCEIEVFAFYSSICSSQSGQIGAPDDRSHLFVTLATYPQFKHCTLSSRVPCFLWADSSLACGYLPSAFMDGFMSCLNASDMVVCVGFPSSPIAFITFRKSPLCPVPSGRIACISSCATMLQIVIGSVICAPIKISAVLSALALL